MFLGVSVHAAFEQFLYLKKEKKTQTQKILFFLIGLQKV